MNEDYWKYRAKMDKGDLPRRIVLGVIGFGALVLALGAWLYSYIN